MSRGQAGYTACMATARPPLAATLLRGAVAGVAGTVVMTGFQKFVEMPLTRRGDSYAPASLAEKVLPVQTGSHKGRKRLNDGTHLALGVMWGAAYAVATHAGLRGQPAVATVFATVYSGDVALNTALGLYQPSTWSGRDWVIDVIDKLVQAEATAAVFDHVVGPKAS